MNMELPVRDCIMFELHVVIHFLTAKGKMAALVQTYGENSVVIPLTENKKCAKYDSSRPIVLDHTSLYTDNGNMLEYTHLWNTITTKV